MADAISMRSECIYARQTSSDFIINIVSIFDEQIVFAKQAPNINTW